MDVNVATGRFVKKMHVDPFLLSSTACGWNINKLA